MKHNRNIIYLAGFIFSLPIALTSYINSSFIASFVDEKFIGLIYALSSVISILALMLAPSVWRKLGGYKFLLCMGLFEVITLYLLTIVSGTASAVMVFILYLSISLLLIFALDEILKIFSRDSSTGRIRGTYLAICSLAWVIAQIASGSIFGAFTFKLIYLLSAGVMAVFFLLASTTLKNIPDPTYDTLNGTKYIKEFFKNKNLRRAYVLSFLLQLFFALMVIYTPIYLSLHLGFSWSEIGIIFSIMLLPFVLVPFRAGVYADKIGERKMLVFGFMLAALATLTLFFIHAHNIFIWAFALFMTRVGASTIEVMSDAYFFKHIKTENEEYVGVYRSASPVAYVVGPLLASVIFIFVPTFNYIYIVLAALMLYGAYLSSTIRRSDI